MNSNYTRYSVRRVWTDGHCLSDKLRYLFRVSYNVSVPKLWGSQSIIQVRCICWKLLEVPTAQNELTKGTILFYCVHYHFYWLVLHSKLVFWSLHHGDFGEILPTTAYYLLLYILNFSVYYYLTEKVESIPQRILCILQTAGLSPYYKKTKIQNYICIMFIVQNATIEEDGS